jgi:cell division septation protein DedD
MEDVLTDDQSHYEISLTAGQAFVAFVLLLLSLAASFAFGLLIGRGQTDEHLAIKTEPAASASAVPAKAPASTQKVVALDDFKEPAPTIAETPKVAPSVEPVSAGRPAQAGPHTVTPQTAAATPVYAQLLSTSDQKTAESLAAKLIENGFSAAYVERTTAEKGTVFRVRVRFPSDSDARAAEPKLKQFSKDVWITK